MAELHSLNRSPFRFGVTGASRFDWRIFLLGFFEVVFILASSYCLKIFLVSGDWNYLLVSLAGAAGFLVIFLLNVFYIDSSWANNFLIFLAGLALFAGFYDRLSLVLAGAALVAYLFFLWGIYAGMAELNTFVRIKFWRVSRKTLPKAVLALVLFSSVAFYLNVKELNWKNPENFFVSEPVFEAIVYPIEPVFQRFVPEFRFSATVRELAAGMAEAEIEKVPGIGKLSGPEKDGLIDMAVERIERQIADLAGVSIDPQAKISSVFYQGILKGIINLPDNARSAAPAVAAIVIFVTIWGFGWLLRFVVTLAALFVYEIFLALGVAEVNLEGGSRETIALKPREGKISF